MPYARRQLTAAIAAALAVAIAAPIAQAREVYLNGVNVGDVRRQTFKDATVYIDENGDVHIDAPRYQVEVVDDDHRLGGKPAATAESEKTGANPHLRQRYFLVTKPSVDGRAQYDVTIKVNGVERKVIKANDPELIVEVSAWFKAGPNTVELVAKKNLRPSRRSTSPADSARIVIGAGHEDGAIVKVDVVNIDFKCDASQLADITKTYVFNAI